MTEMRLSILDAYDRDHPATVVALAPGWLEDHPSDLAVTIHYAVMLYRMTHYDEALEILETALGKAKHKKARCFILWELGNLERYRDRSADAERRFAETIELSPDDATGYIFLGGAQAVQGKLNEAEDTHRRGSECSEGQRDEAFYNLGIVLRAQGRLEESADALRQAIEIDPDYEEAVEALQDVEMAIELHS